MRSELSARLDAYFKLTEHGTTVRTEILAGITTFLTMAYIAFANPAMLSDAGMDFGAVFVATCLAAAIGTAIMGLHANYPVALAPGMGLNAFFAYGVVLGMGHSWQVALGVVFVSGVLFMILSLLPVREWIIDSIPKTLKLAISAGIGLFLGIIALRNAGIVVDDPITLVGLGNLHSAAPLLAVGGFVLIIALDHRGVPGAIMLGILATTALGVGLGVAEWEGIASLPPDPSPTLLQLDVGGALTEFAREKLAAGGFPKDRIVVKSNSTELGDISDTSLSDRSFALYAGRLSEEKGVHTLLDAWKRLARASRC